MYRSVLVLSLLAACGKTAPEATPEAGPTAADAEAFAVEADAKLRELWVASAQAAWTYATDITDEHAAASAAAEERSMEWMGEAVPRAAAFDGVEGVDADTRRQIDLLKIASFVPAPSNAAKRTELAGLLTAMEGAYGKGEYCVDGNCRDLGALEDVLATSRDYDEQLDAWQGWRTISPPIRENYSRFVALGNEGAREIGFDGLSELWRSGYDMDPDAFDVEVERLWQEVKPLYEQLHCHVRAKLSEHYGADKVSTDGKIPAHLLGNMWAQSWDNLYPMLTPFPEASQLDVTGALVDKGYDHLKMVKSAESFFTSLGLDPLPATFWERSMFLKPEDRDAVCHASAWDVTYAGDIRIKMCIRPTFEDFITIHHELGHNYYYQYYYKEPVLFQSGANDGFHEGIGDTLALSVTPAYLNKIGLLDDLSETPEAVLNKQMLDALQKLSFLPFGRMIDKWRWGVFSGEIAPEDYNAAWWKLREQYQGIEAPVERSEADFDPGAKYHIPANTPYMRYFLSHVLQFQFHKALCDESGHEGPLYTCSIYGSEKAGDRLKAMLAMGASEPWPDALETIAGTRQMSAAPMVAFFEPLLTWLEAENEGRTCGW